MQVVELFSQPMTESSFAEFGGAEMETLDQFKPVESVDAPHWIFCGQNVLVYRGVQKRILCDGPMAVLDRTAPSNLVFISLYLVERRLSLIHI